MGLTYLHLEIANPARPKKRIRVKFLIDSGATYSFVPATLLKKVGIKPTGFQEFILANGDVIRRRRGDAIFFFNGDQGAAPVVFGEEGDANLLGVVTLGSLGKVLDPIHRTLRPAKMMMA